MTAKVLPTHTPQLFDLAVERAAQLLRAGEVVALPTETVYGLAANAMEHEAVSKIFAIKGRPIHNPLIVHVTSLAMARRCVVDWPAMADSLANAFWPGPLTLVLPRSQEIRDVVTAAGPTVGVRWPSHPFIQAVILACGFPLAAPSANPSNQLSPTSAEHVWKSLGDKIPLIVDGGQCQVGIESTVLDVSALPPRILRPGMIHAEAILAVTGALSSSSSAGSDVLKSPGLLPKHYSPKAKLLRLSWHADAELRQKLDRALGGHPASRTYILAHSTIPSAEGLGGVSVIPHDAKAYARAIYAELHRCDEAGAELIVIEELPESAEWQGIRDRLQRAAAG
jgi:L-threonylcarbamoyladenylate synthase